MGRTGNQIKDLETRVAVLEQQAQYLLDLVTRIRYRVINLEGPPPEV